MSRGHFVQKAACQAGPVRGTATIVGRSTDYACGPGLKMRHIRLRPGPEGQVVTSEATADMANNPKKMKDPTDEALTAIQEVLSATDEPMTSRAEPAPEQPAAPPREAGRRQRRAAAMPPPSRRTCSTGRRRPTTMRGRASRAANDDRQSIGQILQTPAAPPGQDLVCGRDRVRARLGDRRRGPRLPVPARPAGDAAPGPAGVPAMIGLAGFVLAPIVFFYRHGAHGVARRRSCASSRSRWRASP